MPEFRDLIGQRFGRLIVIYPIAKRTKLGRIVWRCECICGNLTDVMSNHLPRGHTQSCGCLQKEMARLVCLQKERLDNLNPNFKHGNKRKGKESRLYKGWGNMKTRCFNSSDSHYKWYGGRGISVCKEWINNYQAFRDWALANGYADDLVIDRINNDGDYEPSNCRWITALENLKKSNIERRKKNGKHRQRAFSKSQLSY